MWFAYLDESKDDNSFFIYSVLIVESDRWNAALAATVDFRRYLKKQYGIYIKKEFHAWKFAAGKGQIANHPIFQKERASIFAEVLAFVATSGFFRVISAVNVNEEWAFERLVNRLNRTAEANGQNCILICDEGQDVVFTRRIRKMRVYNPIPSNQGTWQDGTITKNLTIGRILEDPIFKKSHMSYFIQLVDFCAYVLLRLERPIDSRTKLGYDKMYRILDPAILKVANPNDPQKLGIIR